MGFELGTDGPNAIVVGVDGSPSSLRAAAYAAGLARRQRTRLIMAYARTHPAELIAAAPLGMAAKEILDAGDEVEAQLRAELQAQTAQWDVDAHFVVRSGNPLVVLSEVASELKADAIVVGSSANVWHRVTGSLAVRLVRARRWPVTVVP